MSHPPHVIGELVVVALKAEKLQHQAPAKQDPFCLFRIGDIAKRTKIDHGGGLYPIWDDQVNMPVTAGYHQMHVQIFDKDTMPNNLMGEGIVDLSKVLREKEHDGYFPLHYRGKQNCGDIYLELTFYSAQNTAVRPQQQVRYPAGQPYPYAGPPPLQQQQHQHRPPPQQHRPPPPQQQQHRPPPPPPQQQQQQHHHQQQQYHPPVHHQHRPLPQRPLPPPQHMSQHQMHRPPPPPQPLQSRPSMVGPPPSHHRPSMGGPPPPPSQHSRPPPHFPQPSSSMGTQHFSPGMPSPQPLLSAAYNPAPTPRPPPPPPGNYSPYPNTGFNEQRPMYSHPPARPNYNPRPYPPY